MPRWPLVAVSKRLSRLISPGQDCSAALFKEWGAFREAPFEYKKGESWDRLVHQGVHLLERFAQDDRVKIRRPDQDLQVKMIRNLPRDNEFVAYIDALGELDGTTVS